MRRRKNTHTQHRNEVERCKDIFRLEKSQRNQTEQYENELKRLLNVISMMSPGLILHKSNKSPKSKAIRVYMANEREREREHTPTPHNPRIRNSTSRFGSINNIYACDENTFLRKRKRDLYKRYSDHSYSRSCYIHSML